MAVSRLGIKTNGRGIFAVNFYFCPLTDTNALETCKKNGYFIREHSLVCLTNEPRREKTGPRCSDQAREEGEKL